MTVAKTSRIETLDWLRGLMALSIMFYHFTCFSFSPPDSSTILGRLGIYGVSVFFILSGLSMAIVYNSYIKNLKTSIFFFIRRIFRIWPLLWVVCIVILPPLLALGHFNWIGFFLNITTLFGFLKPHAYMATGAWSIGNEMVYYSLTPLIIILFNYKKWLGNMLFFITVSVGAYFSFVILKPDLNLGNQWALYVNPFNNLFLYIMGIAIYYNFKNLQINTKLNITILICSVLLFCLFPFGGDQISIVTGIGRVFFVVISFFIVLSFYKLKIELPKVLANALESFGVATYGVYLIHPVLYLRLIPLLRKSPFLNSYVQITIVAILTIIIATLSYRTFELRFIRIGKYLTTSNIEKKKLT